MAPGDDAHPRAMSGILSDTSDLEPGVETTAGTCGLILAGGSSTRWGGRQPKQLEPFAGEPLLRRVARQALASRLAGLLVVLGYRATEVAEALAGLPVRQVVCKGWAAGQSASLRAGLAAAGQAAAAVLILNADQPFVDAGLIDRILELRATTGAPIVAPRHRGRSGPPVLFERSLFGELAELSGDHGARPVLDRHADTVAWLELDTDLPLLDLDAPADLARLAALVPADPTRSG